MATFNIRIQLIDNAAARRLTVIENRLNSVTRASNNVGAALRRAFAALGSLAVLRELNQLTDTFATLQNQIRLVTDGQAQLAVVTEDLFSIANETRTSFEATARTYTRTARAAAQLGLSQAETLRFTEQLSRAVTISGASATEANAALLQFSQGLQQGRLNGDELRSVLEQLPIVADVIARRFGVTRGELRELGAQGRLTAREIIAAFEDASESLEEQFGTTVPTLSQAFVVLRNRATEFIGGLDQSLGVTRTLAQAVIGLSNNLELLARVLGTVTTLFAVNLARQAIPAATAALLRFNIVAAANPFIAIAGLITAAITALAFFSDEIRVSSEGFATLADTALATFEVILEGLDTFSAAFSESFFGNTLRLSIEENLEALSGVFDFTFNDILRGGAQLFDDFLGLANGTFRALVTLVDRIGDLIVESFTRAFNRITPILEDVINTAIDGINQFSGVLGFELIDAINLPRLVDDQRTTLEDIGTALAESFASGFTFTNAREVVEDIISRAEDIANARLAQEEFDRLTAEQARRSLGDRPTTTTRADPTLQRVLDGLDRERRLLQLTSREREIQNQILRVERTLKRQLTEEERNELDIKLRLLEVTRNEAELRDQVNAPIEEYNNLLAAGVSLLAQQIISQRELDALLAGTQLGQQLEMLREQLAPQDETQRLGEQLETQLEMIRRFQELRILSVTDANDLILEAQRQYAEQVQAIEQQRFSVLLQAGSQTFGALAEITRGFVGEQSTAYRALFAVSKAFALADSIVQIRNAVAKAANTPFPANIAAIATTVANTAGIISSIQSTTLGFQNGGVFDVGGAGGADSQFVSFRATPGERVSVETPQQVRDRERGEGDGRGGAPQETTIVNLVDSADLVNSYLTTSAGERAIVNVIGRNAPAIQRVLNNG